MLPNHHPPTQPLAPSLPPPQSPSQPPAWPTHPLLATAPPPVPTRGHQHAYAHQVDEDGPVCGNEGHLAQHRHPAAHPAQQCAPAVGRQGPHPVVDAPGGGVGGQQLGQRDGDLGVGAAVVMRTETRVQVASRDVGWGGCYACVRECCPRSGSGYQLGGQGLRGLRAAWCRELQGGQAGGFSCLCLSGGLAFGTPRPAYPSATHRDGQEGHHRQAPHHDHRPAVQQPPAAVRACMTGVGREEVGQEYGRAVGCTCMPSGSAGIAALEAAGRCIGCGQLPPAVWRLKAPGPLPELLLSATAPGPPRTRKGSNGPLSPEHVRQ